MRILASFISKGRRADNLDRIISKDGMNFILDGYKCTESDMDALASSARIDEEDRFYVSDCQGSFCFAGVSISDGAVSFYHAGDCRIYAHGVGLLTSDQTIAWSKLSILYDDKHKVADYVRRHPSKNLLTGKYDDVYGHLPFLKQNRFDNNVIVCSDGFWNEFSEDEMFDLLVAPDTIKMRVERMAFMDNAACIVLGP